MMHLKRHLAASAAVLLASIAIAWPAAASTCFLATVDQSCVRIDATGELAFQQITPTFEAITLTTIDPHLWEKGVTVGANETAPAADPDQVEFNIVFSPLGTSIEASSWIIFTDRFKFRDITGDVTVSLWLTDIDHNIITSIVGWDNGDGVLDYVARDTQAINAGANDWSVFNLAGSGGMAATTEWWDYHLAFDFTNATLGNNAAIELIAPSNFTVCKSGTDFTDGPCAFGVNLGMNFTAVPAPSPLFLLGFALVALGVFRSRGIGAAQYR